MMNHALTLHNRKSGVKAPVFKRGMKRPRRPAHPRVLLTNVPMCAIMLVTCQKARRGLGRGNPTAPGYGRESPGHPSQCANEVAAATEAQICMRARAHRLEVLSVSIKTPFRTSVERWNDGRTPCIHAGEYQAS